MAATTLSELAPRYNAYNCYNGYCRTNNRWYGWGRWVLLGIIVFFAFLVMLSCVCVARRRRRRGAAPLYGTGWMAPAGKQGEHNVQEMHNYQQGYNPQSYQQGYYGQSSYNGYPNPPPAYGQQQQQQPQHTGQTFTPSEGYYGDSPQPQPQQQYGVQPPPSSYQPDATYSPPAGPPPAK